MKPATLSASEASTDSDTLEPTLPKKSGFWRKLGAGSLAISLMVHAIIIALGVFLVVAVIPPPPEKIVDFTASGGGGGAPVSSPARRKLRRASSNNHRTGWPR